MVAWVVMLALQTALYAAEAVATSSTAVVGPTSQPSSGTCTLVCHTPLEHLRQQRQGPLSQLLSSSQQQLPLFAGQLLQRMRQLHQQHTVYSTAPAVLSEPQPQQQQQQQQQHQHQHEEELSPLAPYQQAAVATTLSQLETTQQRLTIRLPPSADVNPVITQLVTHYCKTHGVLVLVSSSDRALALKATLKTLLGPSGINPRLIPGELISSQHKVVIVDLHNMRDVPSAAINLQQQQHSVPQGLVIFEEGFLSQQGNPSDSSSSSGGNSSSSSSSVSEGWHLYDDSKRSLADQLLRTLRYFEPNPNKLIVSISSRGWQTALQQQQQRQQLDGAGTHSRVSSSSSSANYKQADFALTAEQCLAAGLIRPIAAMKIPNPAAAAAASSSSSGSSSSQIAAVLGAVAGAPGKALVYAANAQHARDLSVAFNLQGISSLVLHEQQQTEEQSAVLREFQISNDNVLVLSITPDSGLRIVINPVSGAVSCIIMAAPTASPEEYVARLAPALLPAAAAAAAPAAAAGRNSQLVVVDLVGQWPAAAMVQQQQQSEQHPKRRRRSSTASTGGSATAAAAGDAAAAAAAAAARGGAGSSNCSDWITCADVLGSLCTQLPPPVIATTDSKPPSSSSSSSSSGTSSSSSTESENASSVQQQQERAQGDLIWTILNDGSWAIPIKRGKGTAMTGMKILWLSKVKRGYVPQLEEVLHQKQPLPGTKGNTISLQKARTLAEAWMKMHHPADAALRELGLEWRERTMTETQMMFCERHKIPYDRSWTRGTVNNMIDRYIVETMHEPPSERQLYLIKHLAPYGPSSMTTFNSSNLSYKTAADHTLQTLLTGDFSAAAAAASKGSKPPSKADAAAAAAFAKLAEASGSSSSSSDGVLPARQALLRDQEQIWDAGLKPKYTWMILDDQGLLLDLMSGCYLRLLPAAAGSSSSSSSSTGTGSEGAGSSSRTVHAIMPAAADEPAAAADGAVAAEDEPAAAAVAGSSSTSGGSRRRVKHTTSSRDSSFEGSTSSSSSSSTTVLNPEQLYHVRLELPDGSSHPLPTLAAAAALITSYSASGTAASSSSSRGPLPVPLAAALDRAEKVAALLVGQQHAFLGREVVRIAGMVGGWKVPARSSEAHMAMPASARQLEALRGYGLTYHRRYTCLDAHRELVRHMKNHGIPEPPATPTQLARISELKLPITPEAIARLTAAEAKAALFRRQLAEEKVTEADKKKRVVGRKQLLSRQRYA